MYPIQKKCDHQEMLPHTQYKMTDQIWYQSPAGPGEHTNLVILTF